MPLCRGDYADRGRPCERVDGRVEGHGGMLFVFAERTVSILTSAS